MHIEQTDFYTQAILSMAALVGLTWDDENT